MPARKPPTDRALLGAEGERRAGLTLLAAGYEIVGRNVRCGAGEIDILARFGGEWVFVEVKTRRGTLYGAGDESVTASKQTKLLRAARAYIEENELGDVDWRYDVVTVTFPRVGAPVVQHIVNAFGD